MEVSDDGTFVSGVGVICWGVRLFLLMFFDVVNLSLEAVVFVSIFFVVLCHMWSNFSCDPVGSSWSGDSDRQRGFCLAE